MNRRDRPLALASLGPVLVSMAAEAAAQHADRPDGNVFRPDELVQSCADTPP